MRSQSQGAGRWEETRKPKERNKTRSFKLHAAIAAKIHKNRLDEAVEFEDGGEIDDEKLVDSDDDDVAVADDGDERRPKKAR